MSHKSAALVAYLMLAVVLQQFSISAAANDIVSTMISSESLNIAIVRGKFILLFLSQNEDSKYESSRRKTHM